MSERSLLTLFLCLSLLCIWEEAKSPNCPGCLCLLSQVKPRAFFTCTRCKTFFPFLNSNRALGGEKITFQCHSCHFEGNLACIASTKSQIELYLTFVFRSFDCLFLLSIEDVNSSTRCLFGGSGRIEAEFFFFSLVSQGKKNYLSSCH